MSGRDRPALLDRPAARLAALGIAAAALAVLAWYHRAVILPPDPAAADSPAQAAFRDCFEPRAARLAASLESGELTQAQAAQFSARAEAFCADRAKRAR